MFKIAGISLMSLTIIFLHLPYSSAHRQVIKRISEIVTSFYSYSAQMMVERPKLVHE
uniref:Uncharacterized protein n=1 Tax=Pristhesancus plagipennis TaxID=1955184 RepID=A0A2K8JWL2_PRIPG|nr:secreted hypothetical protein [Pristhesancus plagipennis]